MAKLLKLRRGTTTQHASFTGAEGEVTIDITKDTAVVHDGSQAGGRPMAREDMSNVSSASIAGQLGTDSIATTKIAAGALPTDVTVASANIVDGTIVSADIADGTIVNADISGSAAIDASKISGLTLDKIYEGDSKVEVVDTGSNGYVSTVIDGTETSRATAGGSTFFTSAVFGAGVNKVDGTGQGISIIYGGGTSNVGLIACTHTSGLIIKNNAAVSFGQNGFPNNYYASFGQNGGSFSTGGTARFDYDGTNINFALNVLPDTDSNYDIGTSAKRFANIYSDATDVAGNITVTGTVDGRDVAADGTKLDGIEASATADQTGAEIASALNGQNIFTTGTIGRDGTDYLEFTDNTRLDIFINNSNEFRFENDGDFHADGDIIAQSTTISSDRRLKENIEVIPNALDKVQALNGVSFDWKKTGEKSAGVIAQEVQEVLPEAVKEVTPVSGGDSHLTVNYHALTSILIESIKELKAEIEELKGGK